MSHRMFVALAALAAVLYPHITSAVDSVASSFLPQWETEEERALRELFGWPETGREFTDPPPYTIRAMPEYGGMEGVLISWDGYTYNTAFTGIVAAAQQVGTVWIAVENSAQRTRVTNILNNAGVPLTNIEWLTVTTDSIWIRDYGPFSVYQEDGHVDITDIIYDRYGRWNDDAFPDWLANAWSVARWAPALRLEGGNFISDGCGTCFSTDRIYEQNQGYLTPDEVDQIMLDYLGCERFIVLERLTDDGTGHIDMFAKLLDADTIIVNSLTNTSDPDYQILEDNAAYVATLTAVTGQLYEVVRLPMGNSYRTYSNSLIINNAVLVPQYFGGSGLDQQARAIYQEHMPGHQIFGIDTSAMVGSGGSIHCITMGFPNPCPRPASVSSLAAQVLPTAARLTWTGAAAAEEYLVFRSEISCDFGLELIGQTAALMFLDWDVEPDGHYFYRVRAMNGCTVTALGNCAEAAMSAETPTPTLVPTATATHSPTTSPGTPTATRTPPTATPEGTATPLPELLEIDLILNQTLFQPGDAFILDLRLLRNGPAVQADAYVLLDVFGNYWFWPEWHRQLSFAAMTIPPNSHQTLNLLAFTWPAGAGSAFGIKFWSALLAPGSNEFLCNYDMEEWAYQP